MQKHIDAAKVIGRNIDLLSEKAQTDAILAKNALRLEQQGTGTASGVYQDAIFDTKEKAFPGVKIPKKA